MSLCSYLKVLDTNVYICGVLHEFTKNLKFGLDERLKKLSEDDIVLIEGYANRPDAIDKKLLSAFLGDTFSSLEYRKGLFIGKIDPVVNNLYKKTGIPLYFKELITPRTLLFILSVFLSERAFLDVVNYIFNVSNTSSVENILYSALITSFTFILGGRYIAKLAKKIHPKIENGINYTREYLIEVLGYIFQPFVIFSSILTYEFNRKYEEIDYIREVGMAYGIYRVIEELRPKNVLVSVGMFHQYSIKNLLKDPERLKSEFEKFRDRYLQKGILLRKYGKAPIQKIFIPY